MEWGFTESSNQKKKSAPSEAAKTKQTFHVLESHKEEGKHLLKTSRVLLNDIRNLIQFKRDERTVEHDFSRKVMSHVSMRKVSSQKSAMALPEAASTKKSSKRSEESMKSAVSAHKSKKPVESVDSRNTNSTDKKMSLEINKIKTNKNSKLKAKNIDKPKLSVGVKKETNKNFKAPLMKGAKTKDEKSVGQGVRTSSKTSLKKKMSRLKIEKVREQKLKEMIALELEKKRELKRQRKERNQKIREYRRRRIALAYRRFRHIFAFSAPQRKVIQEVLLIENVLNTIRLPNLAYNINLERNVTTDYRLDWIEEKVLNYFNIPHKEAFSNLMNQKNGKYKELIYNLVLGRFGSDMENSVLFFFENKYEQTRYKLVRMKSNSGFPLDESGWTMKAVSSLSELFIPVVPTEYEKSTSNNDSQKDPSSPALSEAFIENQKVPTAYMPVKYKKIISQVHVVTVTKMCSLINKGKLYDQDFFYIVRKPQAIVPYCDSYLEAFSELPKYFHTGNFKIRHIVNSFCTLLKIMQLHLSINLREPNYGFDAKDFVRESILKFSGRIQLDSFHDKIIWNNCYNGVFVFLRYCLEKNKLPIKCYSKIKDETIFDRIKDLLLPQKRVNKSSLKITPSDPLKLEISEHSSPEENLKELKKVKKHVPLKKILNSITENVLKRQMASNNLKEINAITFYDITSPHTMNVGQRVKYSHINDIFSKLNAKTEWYYSAQKRGSAFHFNIRSILNRHKNIETLSNDKIFISKISKFKDLRKWLKHLKSYASAEIPKHKLGVYQVFRHWKKRELLIYPFLRRIDAPSFQFVLKFILATNPELGTPFLEDANLLRVIYKRARLHSLSLKGVIVLCKEIYNTPSVKYTTELLYKFLKFIRMMWTTTIYLNDPEHFIDFLHRIQHVILSKTKQILEINRFLSIPGVKAQKVALQVLYLMKTWRDSLFKVFRLVEIDCGAVNRILKIAEYGLLLDINNMTKMAYDLFYLAKHFKYYTNLFSRRLGYAVEDEYKVHYWHEICSDSTLPLRTTNYDIFDFANDKRWDNILRQWYQNLPILEERSKLLLDSLFKNPRSSVAATKYLLSLKPSVTTKQLYAHLINKFECCAKKLISEVKNIILEVGELIENYTEKAYRNQPTESIVISWVENLIENIVPYFRYVTRINEFCKRIDVTLMKEVYFQFLEFYHIQHTVKLIAFMAYRMQSDFRKMKYFSSQNIEIKFSGPDESFRHYIDPVTPHIEKFLSSDNTSSITVLIPKKKKIFRKGGTFEWFNTLELKNEEQVAVSQQILSQGSTDVIIEEVIEYFNIKKEIKVGKEHKIYSMMNKFVKAYYTSLMKSKIVQQLRRIDLEYLLYDIFLYTGKISTSFIPVKLIKGNVSSTKNFIVSDDRRYIFFATTSRKLDENEQAPPKEQRSFSQNKNEKHEEVKNHCSEVAKLVTHGVTNVCHKSPKCLVIRKIPFMTIPMLKYFFINKLNKWQNEELRYIVESGSESMKFPYSNELLMLALIRELIYADELIYMMQEDETYKNNRSLIPSIRNRCELNPVYEFMLISSIYRNLNKMQLMFLETLVAVFQLLFFKERDINKQHHICETLHYVCDTLSPCEGSLPSSGFDYLSEMPCYTEDNAYFDDFEHDYVSDNIFGFLLTLPDFMIFYRNSFICFEDSICFKSIDSAKESILQIKEKSLDEVIVSENKFSNSISQGCDVESDLLIDFVFENFTDILRNSKKNHKTINFGIRNGTGTPQSSIYKDVYHRFDEIYPVESLGKIIFGIKEDEVFYDDDTPLGKPVFICPRQSKDSLVEIKENTDESDNIDEESEINESLTSKHEGERSDQESANDHVDEEIDSGDNSNLGITTETKAEQDVIDIPKMPDTSKIKKKEIYHSDNDLFSKCEKMLFLDNISDHFRSYCSFINKIGELTPITTLENHCRQQENYSSNAKQFNIHKIQENRTSSKTGHKCLQNKDSTTGDGKEKPITPQQYCIESFTLPELYNITRAMKDQFNELAVKQKLDIKDDSSSTLSEPIQDNFIAKESIRTKKKLTESSFIKDLSSEVLLNDSRVVFYESDSGDAVGSEFSVSKMLDMIKNEMKKKKGIKILDTGDNMSSASNSLKSNYSDASSEETIRKSNNYDTCMNRFSCGEDVQDEGSPYESCDSCNKNIDGSSSELHTFSSSSGISYEEDFIVTGRRDSSNYSSSSGNSSKSSKFSSTSSETRSDSANSNDDTSIFPTKMNNSKDSQISYRHHADFSEADNFNSYSSNQFPTSKKKYSRHSQFSSSSSSSSDSSSESSCDSKCHNDSDLFKIAIRDETSTSDSSRNSGHSSNDYLSDYNVSKECMVPKSFKSAKLISDQHTKAMIQNKPKRDSKHKIGKSGSVGTSVKQQNWDSSSSTSSGNDVESPKSAPIDSEQNPTQKSDTGSSQHLYQVINNESGIISCSSEALTDMVENILKTSGIFKTKSKFEVKNDFDTASRFSWEDFNSQIKNPKLAAMLWPLDKYCRPIHPQYLKPLKSNSKTLNMLSYFPFIHQKFIKESNVQNIYMFLDHDSSETIKESSLKDLFSTKSKLNSWYEIQKSHRNMAKNFVKRYAKFPSIDSTNNYIDRLFSSYSAFLLRRRSKNNEIAQMQPYWNAQATKNNKFMAWKYSYIQDEFPICKEIENLSSKIKNTSLKNFLRPIIKQLNAKWNGSQFNNPLVEEIMLEYTWRKMCSEYPELYNNKISFHPGSITENHGNTNSIKRFIVKAPSKDAAIKCDNKCVGDFKDKSINTLIKNGRKNRNHNIRNKRHSLTNEEELIGLAKKGANFSIMPTRHSSTAENDIRNLKSGNLSNNELNDIFTIIMNNRLNYCKKCMISFMPGEKFFELVLNSKHFVESRLVKDSSVKYLCNDYRNLVNKMLKLIPLVTCYNNFILQLTEEENYFFREFIGMLTLRVYQNLKTYMDTRILIPEFQNVLLDIIPVTTQTSLRQLREMGGVLKRKLIEIENFKWFKIGYPRVLKSYLRTMINKRKWTQARFLRTAYSANYQFKVLDFIVENNYPGKPDNPKLFMFYENFEMRRIAFAMRNIQQNYSSFTQFLFSTSLHKPVLHLMFRGKSLYYDVPLKDIADLLLSIWFDYIQRFRYLPRWKAGTCENVDFVRILSKNVEHSYSLFDEWLRMIEIRKILYLGMMKIRRAIKALADYRNRWNFFTSIWEAKRQATIKYMFLHKNFDILEITESLNFFIRYNHLLKETSKNKQVEILGFSVIIKQVTKSLISRFEKFSISITLQIRQRILNFCQNCEHALLDILDHFKDKDSSKDDEIVEDNDIEAEFYFENKLDEEYGIEDVEIEDEYAIEEDYGLEEDCGLEEDSGVEKATEVQEEDLDDYESKSSDDILFDNVDHYHELVKFFNIVIAINNYKELEYRMKCGMAYVKRLRLIACRFGLQFGDDLSEAVYHLKEQFAFAGMFMAYKNEGVELEICQSTYLTILINFAIDFRIKFELFAEKYWFTGPRNCCNNLNYGLELMKLYVDAFTTIVDEKEAINTAEKLLKCRISEFPLYNAIYEDYQIQLILYTFYECFKEDYSIWKGYKWGNFVSRKVSIPLEGILKAFQSLPPHIKSLPVGASIRKLIGDISSTLPLLEKLKSPDLKARHWKQLKKRTEYRRIDYKNPRLKMEVFFKWKLHKFPEIIDEILEFAANEAMVKKKILNIVSALSELTLQIVPYYNDRTYRGVALDTNDEVLIAIDDFTLEFQSLTSSPYSAPFLTNIHRWEKILMVVHEVLTEWLSVQRKWKYLESVFVSGDLRNQLPVMAKKFDEVDKTYLLVTSSLIRQRKVLSQCLKPDTFNKFSKLSEILDECQKTLVNYLDTKRNSFPRFYFISNDELLSILAAQSPEGIQDQMFKIFDNVCMLKFRPKKSRSIRKKTVSGMISCEKEVLDFKTFRSTNAAIEKWMTGIVNEMRKSLKILTRESILSYGNSKFDSRIDWMFHTLGVCVIAANKTFWTANVELAFMKFKRGYNKAMKDLLYMVEDQIDEIVLRVRGPLLKNERKKLNTVLIVDVHSKDIVAKLVSESITKRTSFEWECQLRYYWKKRHRSLRLRQCSGFFQYGYEYMGLNGRLVITPLTDRIFLTITQALALKMGGAPAGPAGTGKTETTKDLAKAMGRLCMVTNCGENMDYIQFGKILMGLCQAGAWGCFDEFNRIDISVLSVITTQLQIIRAALQNESVNYFKFEGYKIYLDRKSGVFITMNPGYAGRTELPETLKSLFRPVVCIVPDLEHICLIMLFSEGFLLAKMLAKKMTLLYSLSKDRLSKQSHYDFGLRSLKPVLTVAGDLKRSSPELDEEVVIMRALRDMNHPKLVPEDEGLFLELIEDLFPGIHCERVIYPSFNNAVEQVLHKMNYMIIPAQINKVVQLYETMMTRHSTAIVGPTRGGKSVIVTTLCEAQTQMNLPTLLVVLNPKAFTVDELYGLLDPKTRDWIDGLLSNVFREMNQPIRRPERHYIMFDGDVDALWIENMNSVMDDNKILTLTSGERMRLLDHCALLFEVGDLRYASPATVSRCGVVFVDADTVGYRAYWDRWLYRRKDEKEIFALTNLFDKFIPTALNLIFKGSLVQKLKPLSLIIPQNEVNLVSQLCCVLESTLPRPPKLRTSLLQSSLQRTSLLPGSFKGSIEEKSLTTPTGVTHKDVAHEGHVLLQTLIDFLFILNFYSDEPHPTYQKIPQITKDYLSYKFQLILSFPYNFMHPNYKYATRGRLALEKENEDSGDDYCYFQCFEYKVPVFKYPISPVHRSHCKCHNKNGSTNIRRRQLFGGYNHRKSELRSHLEKIYISLLDPQRTQFISKWQQLPEVQKLINIIKKVVHNNELNLSDFCNYTFLTKGINDLWEKDFRRLMKSISLVNIVNDMLKILKKEYSENINCKLGDRVIKYFKHIIQKRHIGQHLSAEKFNRYNDVQFLKEVQISQKRHAERLQSKRILCNKKKRSFSKSLFKLKDNFTVDKDGYNKNDNCDMFLDNELLTDWMGSYWHDKIYNFSTVSKELKQNTKYNLEEYKVTVSNLAKYNKILNRQSQEFSLPLMKEEDKLKALDYLLAVNTKKMYSANNLLTSEIEIEIPTKLLPYKETYAMRKLSFQYRSMMFKMIADVIPVSLEEKKRSSLEYKKVIDMRESVTEKPKFKAWTRTSAFATPAHHYETIPQSNATEAEIQERKKYTQKIRSIFVEALYASLGAAIIERDRSKFDDFVKKAMNIPEYPDTEDNLAPFHFIPCRMPLLYNYRTDLEKNCWVAWKDILKPYKHDKNKNFDEIFVPTEESSRIGRLLQLMQSVHRPVILVGESGTAKTAIMMEFLRNISLNYVKLTLTFSSRTTSLDVQRNIESSLDKLNKHTLGPPMGKEMIIFIDDLNMPQFDEYGTQQPIALLKLTVEKNGLFDREGDLSWISLQNVVFIGAMGMTARSDQVVDPRFISHFCVFNLTPPSDETINHIYISILNGHTDDFVCDIHSITPDIIKATLAIYRFLREDIPPSPIRFHYIFSLRDLSRVTAGLLQTRSHIFKTKKEFVRVWRNEIMRVFYDRLCLSEDQSKVYDYIYDVIDDVFPHMRRFVRTNPLIFGDYEHFLNPDEPRFYKDLYSYEKIYKIFSDILEDYNSHYIEMDLVLFEDALDHLTRIHRVLRLNRGNLLAIGVGGCGKRSLITLSSYAAGCKMFSINLCKGYNESFFKEDLKKLHLISGADQIKTTFLFTSSHIVQEDFLEYINSILTVGYIPALFSDEDKDGIINKVRKNARVAGCGRTKGEVWNYFLDTCKNSLHMVLSMSPLGNALRVRCRSFPSLVNNSTIDWIFPWPKEALYAVANRFLPNELFSVNQRKAVIHHIVFTHKSVMNFADEFLIRYNRTCFITPKHYLDFIRLYIKFVKEKSDDNITRTGEYELGLQKMVEAYITVEEISAETLKQKVIVEEQNIACEILLKELTAATKATTEKQNIAKAKSKEIHIQSIEIDKNKKEAEEALSTALPALNEARLALDQLNKNDITEIRSFATPPLPVQIVCECILILSGYTEIDWKTAKGMMADPNFLNTLKNMNVNKITKIQQKNVRDHLAKSTKMDQMAVISKAGYGLLMFIRAVLNYCVVYRIVRPKQEKVEMLEKKFAKALQTLEALNAEVKELERILNELNEKYSSAMREKHRIQEEMEIMLYRLAIANKLLSGLSSENERWKKEHANLKEEYEKIVGNCLLTSSFLAYTGAFNWELRQEMMYESWRNNIYKLKIPFSKNYLLQFELMDEMSISKLYTEGLPPDDLSLQNALLVLCSTRFPLCIDPQQQALRWLSKREKSFQPKILTFDDKNCLTELENSIRTGIPVIFKDVEYVDSIIENVLEKNIRDKRGQKIVLIGNKEIEYHDKFRLYLVSKLPNPQFDSWVYTKSTVVNCIVTINGLEDQLLNVVARHERPDLEEARERLIEQMTIQKQSVKFFEKTLLIELANAKGNLLDNTVLIETLESTKSRVSEMQKDLREAEENQAGFDVTRNEYRPVAKRGALLYFVLYDMSAMNPMYIYSLDSYLKVFTDSLSKPVISIIINVRVKKFIAILTKKVYDYGCNGLFERDKLLFSFQIALRLQQDIGLVSEDEFTFLIKGDSSLEKCKKPCPAKWFPAERWKDLVKLNSAFPVFEDVLTEFEKHISDWEKWYNLAAPEKGKMPYDKFSELKPFEKLMLFRCLRVDRISECIPDYVNSIMGPYFNKPPMISLEQIVSQSTPDDPVMFVLCPGANPIPRLLKCADKESTGALGTGSLRVSTISLGQGQQPRATKMFFDARRKGYWVVFENCHLLPFFIASIEKTREKQETKPHPSFRIWYTTEPTDQFPLSVLQTTSRVVLEIAESFKLNLARTVRGIDKVDFREQVKIHPSFGHIIYVLAFFHAVLLERKKFGQVGFNINYDFSESDFDSCYQLIKRYLKKTSHNMRKAQKPGYDVNAYNQYLYDRVPWEILRYLIGEIVYGGRVIDYYDRRTVSTYLEEYMDNFIYQKLSTFCFFKRMTLKYPVPLYNSLNLYNKQIRHLPDTTFPGVFGLHPNVEIAYNDAKTTKFWKNLMSLQPAEGSASKASSKKESVVKQITYKIRDIVPKTLYDVQKAKIKYEDMMTTQELIEVRKIPRDPTVIILFQELGMFNVLIESLSSSLVNLTKAISGEIAMDALLENIFDCLYEGEIPQSWRKLIPQTKKSLGQWMTHFKNRIVQYDDWLKEFKMPAIWLSGLHVPQSYLTAVMQRTTRLQGWSLDQTALFSFITKTKKAKKIKTIPQLGCYIRDLFIQGARWDCDKNALQPPRRKVQVEPLPILAIRPIKVDQRKFVKSFQTPVYITTDRRNAMGVGFVFEADIQTNSHYSVWVMKGVCMLLNKE